MNGRLDKVVMTNKLIQLKRELHYKCAIGEKGKWECIGANDYLNRVFNVIDEFGSKYQTKERIDIATFWLLTEFLLWIV